MIKIGASTLEQVIEMGKLVGSLVQLVPVGPIMVLELIWTEVAQVTGWSSSVKGLRAGSWSELVGSVDGILVPYMFN